MNKTIKILSAIVVAFAAYAIVYSSFYHCAAASSKMQTLDLSDTSNVFYLSEKSYATAMDRVVGPFLDSSRVTGKLHTGGHVIAYEYYLLQHPKASVVISHGYTERKEKFREMAYYFLKMGYQVFVPDHYSHGQSTRFNGDSSLVYVESYDVFTHDLKTFVDSVAKPHSVGTKMILFGHSMGGGIAARTLEEYPGIVDAAVLSAPLMKLLNVPPDYVKAPLASLMSFVGKGADYTLGHRAYDPKIDKEYHEDAPATYCEARGKYWHELSQTLCSSPSYGASWKLVSVFLQLSHDVVKKENAAKIGIPVLLFQAEKDNFVAPEGHYEFAAHVPKLQFYYVKGAGHEIYFESDKYMVPYYHRINRFIDSIIAGK